MSKETKGKRILSICAKCNDMFSATYKDESGELNHDGYVPSFMPNDHYGDYVELEIDIDTGQILNWKTPNSEQLRTQLNGQG